MNGINLKKAAPVIRNAAKSGTLTVQRKEDTLYLTDGAVLIWGAEGDLWDLVRNMPRPIPQGQGVWRAGENGGAFYPSSSDLVRLVDLAAADGTQPLQTTGLTMSHHSSKNGAAIFKLPDEYMAVSADYFAIFYGACEFRAKDGRGPIQAWCNGELVGAVMPIINYGRPLNVQHLVPLAKQVAMAGD